MRTPERLVSPTGIIERGQAGRQVLVPLMPASWPLTPNKSPAIRSIGPGRESASVHSNRRAKHLYFAIMRCLSRALA